MEILGLSDSTPRSENRLKSLFWPSIDSAADVDYLGAQGYWVCAVVAVVAGYPLVAMGHPIYGGCAFLYFFLGGVGVRERSRYAAAVIFFVFLIGTIRSPGVVTILLCALLLSNLRATSISAAWKPESEEAALPPRLSEMWTDKFADRLPMWLWPKVRIPYYVFSAMYLLLIVVTTASRIARNLVYR